MGAKAVGIVQSRKRSTQSEDFRQWRIELENAAAKYRGSSPADRAAAWDAYLKVRGRQPR